MKYLYLVLNWTFSLIFGTLGIAGVTSDPAPAIPLILLSLFLLPPIRSFVFNLTRRSLSKKTRAWIIVILFATFVALSGINNKQEGQQIASEKKKTIEYFNTHKDSLINLIEVSINSGNYDNALQLIEKYSVAGDSKLNEIEQKVVAKSKEAELENRVKSILNELISIPASQTKRNLDLYNELVKLQPDNPTYSEKANYYAGIYAEDLKNEEEKQELARIAIARKEKIESQFSAWSGAHRNLEYNIKQAMNDPDSYKHVETVYWDLGDYLIVRTTFRGKNAFGGVIKNTVKAKVSLNGDILEILEQY